jgi:peptidoglycan/LPS O-acetylase OafA/YrhL
MNLLKHRPEIDGLRAVAVLPVVLFHAGLGCPGGYVGVDVFFVISGYLITALIQQSIDRNDFSLLAFWERRLRRIAPALVVVVAATLAAGWWLLLPGDFESLGKSAVAQSLMVANFHFWQQSGYFDGPAELKPLLHTWSLAVEEQFYLLLPLALVALSRTSLRATRIVLGLALAASLALSIYGVREFPSATFYLLPTRAWELLLGSLIALRVLAPGESPGAERFATASIVHRPPATRRRLRRSDALAPWVNEALSALGLALIAFAVFAYDRDTPFPGAAALIPCLGTAAVIWANAPTLTRCARPLTSRPMTFIGQISYSLYLWHWPVFVYGRYWSMDELTAVQSLALIGVSVALAALSWALIETPFRRGVVLKTRSAVFASSLVATATLVAAGTWFDVGEGLPDRLPPHVVALDNGRIDQHFQIKVDLASVRAGRLIEVGVPDESRPIELLIWGDSHAMAILPAMGELCREHNVRAVAAAHSATAPLLGYESIGSASMQDESVAYNDAIVEFVRQRRIGRVLMIGKWGAYGGVHLTSPAETAAKLVALREHLRRTIATLTAAGVDVWIMKQVPRQDCDVSRVLARAALTGRDLGRIGISRDEHRRQMAPVDEIIDGVAGPNVTVIDPAELLFDADGVSRMVSNGKPLYRDTNHLTVHGSKELRPLFEPVVRIPMLASGKQVDESTNRMR